jgi:hypothetical protein
MPDARQYQLAIRTGRGGDPRGSRGPFRLRAAMVALLCTLFLEPCLMAAVSREQAIRIASDIPLIKDGMRGVEEWQVAVTPPSEASGAWGVTFHLPGDPKPLLGARVDSGSGEVLSVWWEQEAFHLSKKPESRLWSADQLMAAKAESPRDVQDAVGDFLRDYLQEHRKAQIRIEYLPAAGRWLVTAHDKTQVLGYVTYADGRILDAHLLGFNWTPPKSETPGPNVGALVPRFNNILALGLALILGYLCFGDHRRLFAQRNRLLAVLFALFAVDMVLTPSPFAYAWRMVMVIVFFALVVRKEPQPISVEEEALPKSFWIAIAALPVAMAMIPIWCGEVGDSSRCGAICARYIIQERRLPYGADIAATGYIPHDRNTYGPAFYLAHVPAEVMVPTTCQYAGGVRKKVGEMGWATFINRPTLHETASRITVTFFTAAFLLGVGVLGMRAGGPRCAAGWVALAALGPATMTYSCDGHTVTMALVVWAIVFLERPLVAGALLGTGAATLFYPAFAVPLWLGWYARKRRGVLAFAAGVGIVGLATLGLTLALTSAPTALDAFKLFLRDTVLFQEGVQGMAGMGLGFWPSHPALQSILQAPVTVAYLVFCLALAFRPRVTRKRDLVAWTAAIFIGTQLWKSYGPGYEQWYWYLVVLALFRPRDHVADAPAEQAPTR